VAVLPPDGVRRDGSLQAAHNERRQYALNQAAKDAAKANVYFGYKKQVAIRFMADVKGDVSDADYFAALGVDDLLIEKIADHTEHVLIRVVRHELLVLQIDSVERDG